MSLVGPGTPAPDFTLRDEEGRRFTLADLLARGRTAVLVFYPAAFSPVCNDQLQIYDAVRERFDELGADLYGVSCDGVWALRAFRERLGIGIPQLSDFEPKGEACRAFGAYHPKGFPLRAIVIVGADGIVKWSYCAENPAEIPGANLIFDGLAAAHA